MAIQAKDRFVENNINTILPGIREFPPQAFKYSSKNLELYLLGKSNKNDLIPVNVDTIDLQRAITFGGIGQFIYTTEGGDLYDACLYTNAEQEVYVYGIRTRQLPEKPKKKKGE